MAAWQKINLSRTTGALLACAKGEGHSSGREPHRVSTQALDLAHKSDMTSLAHTAIGALHPNTSPSPAYQDEGRGFIQQLIYIVIVASKLRADMHLHERGCRVANLPELEANFDDVKPVPALSRKDEPDSNVASTIVRIRFSGWNRRSRIVRIYLVR